MWFHQHSLQRKNTKSLWPLLPIQGYHSISLWGGHSLPAWLFIRFNWPTRKKVIEASPFNFWSFLVFSATFLFLFGGSGGNDWLGHSKQCCSDGNPIRLSLRTYIDRCREAMADQIQALPLTHTHKNTHLLCLGKKSRADYLAVWWQSAQALKCWLFKQNLHPEMFILKPLWCV